MKKFPSPYWRNIDSFKDRNGIDISEYAYEISVTYTPSNWIDANAGCVTLHCEGRNFHLLPYEARKLAKFLNDCAEEVNN